jgi:hypothetical protein
LVLFVVGHRKRGIQDSTSCKFVHPVCTSRVRQGKVYKVPVRTPTSVFLLSALLIGMLSPTGMCTLMCERHSRTESQIHCTPHPYAMPGMTHDHSAMNHPAMNHSAMNHPGTHPARPVMAPQSCPSNCGRAQPIDLSRKVVPQVTTARAGVVVLDTQAKLLASDAAAPLRSGGGHAPPAAYGPSFRILRI